MLIILRYVTTLEGWPASILGVTWREKTDVLSSTIAWTPLWAIVEALLKANVHKAATEKA